MFIIVLLNLVHCALYILINIKLIKLIYISLRTRFSAGVNIDNDVTIITEDRILYRYNT